MQRNNIWKTDVVNADDSLSMKDSIIGIIENSGVAAEYYLYDTITKAFLTAINISIYLDASIIASEYNTNVEKIKPDVQFNAIMASEPFRTENKKPTNKDRVKIGDDEYFVRDIILYDKNKHTSLFEQSVLVSFSLIKVKAFTRNTLI